MPRTTNASGVPLPSSFKYFDLVRGCTCEFLARNYVRMIHVPRTQVLSIHLGSRLAERGAVFRDYASGPWVDRIGGSDVVCLIMSGVTMSITGLFVICFCHRVFGVDYRVMLLLTGKSSHRRTGAGSHNQVTQFVKAAGCG